MADEKELDQVEGVESEAPAEDSSEEASSDAPAEAGSEEAAAPAGESAE